MVRRSSPPRANIFISYRRADASGHAGRLYDTLVARSDRRHVFMDIDAIRPGTDFAKALASALAECDMVFVVIGRSWVRHGHQDRSRLDDPDDYVRREIEAALGRGVPVVPLLVQGATMPTSGELPRSLADLTTRQAFELSDRRWRSDLAALIEEIDRLERAGSTTSDPVDERIPVAGTTDGSEVRPVRGTATVGAGISLSLLGLLLNDYGTPLWGLGPLVAVIGAVMVALTHRWRAVETRRRSMSPVSEPWHGFLAVATILLAVLAVAGIVLLEGPAIGPFARATGGILLLLVLLAGYLSHGWTSFDSLAVWRQFVVALIAALVLRRPTSGPYGSPRSADRG